MIDHVGPMSHASHEEQQPTTIRKESLFEVIEGFNSFTEAIHPRSTDAFKRKKDLQGLGLSPIGGGRLCSVRSLAVEQVNDG